MGGVEPCGVGIMDDRIRCLLKIMSTKIDKNGGRTKYSSQFPECLFSVCVFLAFLKFLNLGEKHYLNKFFSTNSELSRGSNKEVKNK